MKHATKATVSRTVVAAVVLLNAVLTMLGYNPLPFSDTAVYEGVTALCAVVTTIWTWWKNNSFTKEAIAADEYLKDLREQEADSWQ